VTRAEVFFREGGNPLSMREEAVHISQLAEGGDTAKKIGKLTEENLTKWPKMSTEQRLDIYKTKIEVEIDAQQRLLEQFKDGDPQYLKSVQHNLDNLQSRMAEVDLGVKNPKAVQDADWLQEAEAPRLFSKNGSNSYKTPAVIAELQKLPEAKLFAPDQLEHILFGNQNKAGKFTGWHHFTSRLPGERVRVVEFGAQGVDKNGVYEAVVEASFDKGKTWIQKTAKKHTFFPDSWSKEKVVKEIASAFKEGRIKDVPEGFDFAGRSESGVLITGYLDDSGKIVSAFPQLER
jgi:Bacterial EndoU nuclease